MKKQKFKYRRVVFGQKIPSNSIKLVIMESITNQKKNWDEERGLNLKIKVTSGYFCGQGMLSYVVATKSNFQIFSIFLLSKGGPTTLII